MLLVVYISVLKVWKFSLFWNHLWVCKTTDFQNFNTKVYTTSIDKIRPRRIVKKFVQGKKIFEFKYSASAPNKVGMVEPLRLLRPCCCLGVILYTKEYLYILLLVLFATKLVCCSYGHHSLRVQCLFRFHYSRYTVAFFAHPAARTLLFTNMDSHHDHVATDDEHGTISYSYYFICDVVNVHVVFRWCRRGCLWRR